VTARTISVDKPKLEKDKPEEDELEEDMYYAKSGRSTLHDQVSQPGQSADSGASPASIHRSMSALIVDSVCVSWGLSLIVVRNRARLPCPMWSIV
jgi:hypothetical protein